MKKKLSFLVIGFFAITFANVAFTLGSTSDVSQIITSAYADEPGDKALYDCGTNCLCCKSGSLTCGAAACSD